MYEIIVAERNDRGVTYNDIELKFGPVLLTKKDEVFYEKWLREYHHLTTVYDAIKSDDKTRRKVAELLNDINILQEVLNIEHS